MALLEIQNAGGIATFTLNRPEALNALSMALRAEITAAFRAVAEDEATGVVILTGAGRAFSAGIDLKELGGETQGEDRAGTDVRMIEALHDCPQPIIGAINGHAITGGFELALACDLLVASTHAVFGDTHARVGIAPGWGLSQKLSRLIGVTRAKELSLTGNFLPAEQAERWGLVNRVVEPEALLPSCEQLALDMLSCDPKTLRRYKQVIDAGYATTLAEGLQLEARASREHMREVKPADIAARRAEIQRRGRHQQR